MSNKANCPICLEEKELQLVDLEDWEENWLLDKSLWNYKEICEDCMQELQIENEVKRLNIWN